MGRRYHCDYCNRSFTDGAENRKKHLESVYHQKLRKAHYDAFRDATTVLREELARKPCRKFQLTGICEYGSGCKYSHLSPADVQRLQNQAELEMKTEVKQSVVKEVSDVELNTWLGTISKGQDNLPADSKLGVAPSLPPVLANIPNIPPSLIPSKAISCECSEISKWGK